MDFLKKKKLFFPKESQKLSFSFEFKIAKFNESIHQNQGK
jgi:hypothetical protein